jgi:hypothetical protein
MPFLVIPRSLLRGGFIVSKFAMVSVVQIPPVKSTLHYLYGNNAQCVDLPSTETACSYPPALEVSGHTALPDGKVWGCA